MKYIIDINKKKCYIGWVYLKNKKLNQNKDRLHRKIQNTENALYFIQNFGFYRSTHDE